MSLFRRPARDERGVVSVIVAVSFLMLCIVGAMVIDLGNARATRRVSQNAADAASLAGANKLYPKTNACTITTSQTTPPCFSDAVAAVKAYTAANLATTDAQWTGCTDSGKEAGGYTVPGQSACITFYGQTEPYTTADSTTAPYKVRVRVPQRDVETSLGVVANKTSIAVSSKARAALKPGTGRSCGLCILGTGTSPLGNGDVTVTGGSVHTNGSIDAGPNGHLVSSPAGMTITATGTCPSGCNPAAVYADLIADPLATSLTLPPPMPATYTSVKANPCVAGPAGGPGIYYNFDIDICALQPGLYVVTGGWNLKNNSNLTSLPGGVTLYFTCANATTHMPRACLSNSGVGEPGGFLEAKNGDVNISAPATTPAPVSGALAGFVVIYDRLNNSGVGLQGNGDTDYTGTIYAPKATLEFPGNSFINVVNGPVVVGGLRGNGNQGGINLTSLNGAFIPTPPEGVSLDQ